MFERFDGTVVARTAEYIMVLTWICKIQHPVYFKCLEDHLQTQLGAHLSLRGSTVLYSTNPFNLSKETKSFWVSGLTSRGAFRGSTVLHIVLTFICGWIPWHWSFLTCLLQRVPSKTGWQGWRKYKVLVSKTPPKKTKIQDNTFPFLVLLNAWTF